MSESLTIQGTTVKAVSPEGQKAQMTVADLLARANPARMDTGEAVLPPGVVSVRSRGRVTVWVHQTPPRVYSFKWIADKSAARFGRGTKYRTVRLGLPYLVVLAVYVPAERGLVQLSHANECFFRTEPLGSLDDEVLYPGLLNCSKFPTEQGNPLSWICTQYLDPRAFAAETDVNKRMRAGFKALLHCLLDTGFNYSSEHHEGSSWFTENSKVDPRVATVERWQQETEKDPLFVLDVPWLRTGHSVNQVVERIFQRHGAMTQTAASAADLARVVFNHAPKNGEAQ